MQVIRNESNIREVGDPDLQGLILRCTEELAEYMDNFQELVVFVIFQAGDDLADLEAVLGFSVLANRFNGVPFGHIDFTPSWDVLTEHPGYYELVYVLDDSGAGVEVFISKEEGVQKELKEMCRRYAVPEVDT